MKPDWDALGEEFENSKKVIIGDVDCTLDKNKKLCEDQGVKGYPTLMYYPPLENEGIKYEGDRSLEALKKFAKTLGPVCGPKFPAKCSEEEKAALDTYMAKELSELTTELEEKEAVLGAEEAKHQELLKSLQAQFEESNKALEEKKAEFAPSLRMVKAVIKEKQPEAAPAADAKAEAKAEL